MRRIKLTIPELSSIYQIDESGQVYEETPLGDIRPLAHTLRSGQRVYKLVAADGRSLPFPAHRLVLMAFLSVDLKGRRVKFLDGNPGNPALSNLEISRELRGESKSRQESGRGAVVVNGVRVRRKQSSCESESGRARQAGSGSTQTLADLDAMRPLDIADQWSCEDIIRMARGARNPSEQSRLRDALMFRTLLAVSNGVRS